MKSGHLAALLLVVFAFVSSFQKTPFGLDLYDEPFYLAPGFKLIEAGDQPLENHILNGPRLHDILNHHLVRPLVSFDVLTLRRVQVGVYGLLLLFFFLSVFRQKMGLIAGFLFVAMLCFDFQLKASWSHNTWARNLFLIHHSFLLLTFSLSGKRGLRLLYGLAGFAMGLVVVAYLPLFPSALVALALVLWRKDSRSVAWSYPLGLVAAIGGTAFYLWANGLGPSWVFAFKATALQSEYGSNTSVGKFVSIFGYLLTRMELWPVLVLGVIVGWRGVRREQKSGLIGSVFFAFSLLVFARVIMKGSNLDALGIWALGTLVAITVGAGVSCLALLARRSDFTRLALVLSSLVGMGCMGMASDGASGATFWLVPTVLPLLLALGTERLKILRVYNRTVRASLGTSLGLIALCVVLQQWGRSYGDVPPAECVRVLSVAPYQGIRTSARRAMLLERVEAAVGENNFAVAYGRMPVVFMFGHVRSSVDTTFVDVHYPNVLHRALLERSVSKGREPGVLFWKKVNGWTWAKDVPVWVTYPSDYPYFELAKCASTKLIEKFEEFEAYETNPEQYRACVNQAPHLARLSN